MLCALLFAFGGAGCSNAVSEKQVRAVEDLYQDGDAAFEQGSWAEAEENYTAALSARGLHPDLYVDVLIKRAVSRAHLSDFARAHEDLALASEGAVSVERIHAARAFVYESEGKIAEADAEMAQAREIDPSVEPFTN